MLWRRRSVLFSVGKPSHGRQTGRKESHPAKRRLRRLVQRDNRARRTRRPLAGARMYRVPPRRIRDLGGAARRTRPPDQEDRRAQRLLPALHPAELPAKGGAARRGLRARGRRGHPRRRQGAGRAADRAADLRDHHQLHVRAVDPFASRPAADDQPVVQRGALGDAHAAVLAHHRISLAGGPYRARHQRGGRARGAHDARGLPRLRRGLSRGAAGRPGARARPSAFRAPRRPTRSNR